MTALHTLTRRIVDQAVSCWFGLLATAVAVSIWSYSLRQVDLGEVGGRGLVSAMPLSFFVSCSVLALGFVAVLARDVVAKGVLGCQLVLAGVFLHGTAIFVQPLARFATAWFHAGYTDYLARTGETLPGLDARFNWPGFFSATGMLTRAAGLDSPVPFLRFAPLLFVGLGALGVFAVAQAATRNRRVPYLATWVFLSADWVGQDYFAPQAVAYVLALCSVVILIRYFQSDPAGRGSSSRLMRPLLRLSGSLPDEPNETVSLRERRVLRTILVVLSAAVIVSHQLTPGVMFVGTAGLVLLRRTSLRLLPVVMFGMFLAWLSFGAIGYWSGHLDDLFGGFGRLGSSVSQNLGDRLTGDPERLEIQRLRLLLTAGVVAIAGIGLVRKARTGNGGMTLVVLAIAPFGVLIGQSYGGEALLRSFFFSLPFLATLCAVAFAPRSGQRFGRTRAGVVWAVLSATVPLFISARYGNEAWDSQTTTEHEAFEFIYREGEPGTVATLASEAPFGYARIDDFYTLPRPDPKVLHDLAEARQQIDETSGNLYLVVTRGQVEFGRIYGGLPDSWAADLVTALLETGNFTVVFENAQSTVLFRPAGGGS